MSVMFQQELPVYRSVDVVVVGAGPAGIGAAVENAQKSLKDIADIILPSCEENAIAHLIEFLEEMYE